MSSKFKICWNYIYIVVKLWMVLACWFLVLVQTEQRILWNDCYNLIQIWIYFKNWVKYVPKLENLEKLNISEFIWLLFCFLLFSNQFLHYVDEMNCSHWITHFNFLGPVFVHCWKPTMTHTEPTHWPS